MSLGVCRLVIDAVCSQAHSAITVDMTALTLKSHGIDRQRARARMLHPSVDVDQGARSQAQVVAVDRDAALSVIYGSDWGREMNGKIGTACLHQLAGHVGQIPRLQVKRLSRNYGAVGAQRLMSAHRERTGDADPRLADVDVTRARHQAQILAADFAA